MSERVSLVLGIADSISSRVDFWWLTDKRTVHVMPYLRCRQQRWCSSVRGKWIVCSSSVLFFRYVERKAEDSNPGYLQFTVNHQKMRHPVTDCRYMNQVRRSEAGPIPSSNRRLHTKHCRNLACRSHAGWIENAWTSVRLQFITYQYSPSLGPHSRLRASDVYSIGK